LRQTQKLYLVDSVAHGGYIVPYLDDTMATGYN